ncbi:MAG: hypothetical protein AB7N80_08985 [Bdellovibrionales bacterium]
MSSAAVGSLLCDGPIYIVDAAAPNRANLIAQLKTLDSRVEVVEFANIADCLESIQTLNNLSEVKCIFLGVEEGPKKCAQFIAECSRQNNALFILATGSEISTEDLRGLISSGVSQVLLRPFSEQTLAQKMMSAESFQKQLVKESQFIPTINEFSHQVERITPTVYVVHLHGWVTSGAELPLIQPEQPKAKLFIDCESLNGLNSIGIRKWLFWIKDLEKVGFSGFEFENVKSRVLTHINSVAGFKPPSGQVNSFYLIYDSDRADLEKEIKFRRDHDFDAESMVLPQIIEVTEQGQIVPLTIDPLFKSQLSFYKGKINTVGRVRRKVD